MEKGPEMKLCSGTRPSDGTCGAVRRPSLGEVNRIHFFVVRADCPMMAPCKQLSAAPYQGDARANSVMT
ncbi:MAG: hypothetical protein CMJ59_00145 [Planctomycetaceae bacterium]|nr:hypothetical protein [Planctomycetaceae bacterium]